jgi:hypothetical protein
MSPARTADENQEVPVIPPLLSRIPRKYKARKRSLVLRHHITRRAPTIGEKRDALQAQSLPPAFKSRER